MRLSVSAETERWRIHVFPASVSYNSVCGYSSLREVTVTKTETETPFFQPVHSISHFGHSQVSQIREISDSFVNRWTLMQGSLNEWDIHKDVLYLLFIFCKYMRIWPSFRQCAPLSWNSNDGPSCFCWQISTSCTRSGLIWLFQLRRMWNTARFQYKWSSKWHVQI